MSTPPSPPSAPAPPPAVPPQKIVLEQPGGMFGRFGKFLWIALFISIIINFSQQANYQSYFTTGEGIQEKYHSLNKTAKDKIAILRLEGLITTGEGFAKRQIDQILKDEQVKAIILRIDSPGGTVTGSDYLYHHLVRLIEKRKIPMVVSMGSLCASGGYYAAMAVGDQQDVIFAEPATWTGSIGVIIPHYDVSGLLAKWDIKDDSIKSHEFKQLLSPTRSLSEESNPEGRKILQELVDESFEGFKDKVRAGRPIFRDNDMKLDEVATGQIFTAQQALGHELIDKIGFIEDAIDRAVELAKLSKDKVRVVQYKRPPTMLDALSGGQSLATGNVSLDLSQLLSLTAPRAYYLSTWLPAIVTNSRP